MQKIINLESFAGGALAERINLALQDVLENIADPNTDWKYKRKLTIDMKFKTCEDRELTEVEILAKTKLAPNKPIGTKLVIGTDGRGGILASEYKNQVQGQSVMRINEETGVISTTAEEKKEENEIDLKGIKLIK